MYATSARARDFANGLISNQERAAAGDAARAKQTEIFISYLQPEGKDAL
jgi:hypothetical protein